MSGVDSLQPNLVWPSRRRLILAVLRVLGIWALLLVVYQVLPFNSTLGLGVLAQLAGAVIALGAALAWELHSVRRSDSPGIRAIESLAALVGLHLFLFAAIYMTLSARDPDGFNEKLNHLDSLYFTISTFATVGFGDITAVSALPRGVVSVQILLNLLIFASAGRLLLGAARTRRAAQAEAPEKDPGE